MAMAANKQASCTEDMCRMLQRKCSLRRQSKDLYDYKEAMLDVIEAQVLWLLNNRTSKTKKDVFLLSLEFVELICFLTDKCMDEVEKVVQLRKRKSMENFGYAVPSCLENEHVRQEEVLAFLFNELFVADYSVRSRIGRFQHCFDQEILNLLETFLVQYKYVTDMAAFINRMATEAEHKKVGCVIEHSLESYQIMLGKYAKEGVVRHKIFKKCADKIEAYIVSASFLYVYSSNITYWIKDLPMKQRTSQLKKCFLDIYGLHFMSSLEINKLSKRVEQQQRGQQTMNTIFSEYQMMTDLRVLYRQYRDHCLHLKNWVPLVEGHDSILYHPLMPHPAHFIIKRDVLPADKSKWSVVASFKFSNDGIDRALQRKVVVFSPGR